MSIEVIKRNHTLRFRAVVRVGRRRISKTFKRKLDAKNWEAEILFARQSGSSLFTNRSEETLNDLWVRYQRDYSDLRNAPATRIMNRSLYLNYIEKDFGNVPLRQLRSEELEVYFNHLRRINGSSNGRINRVRQLLHVMLNRAVAWRMIETNPASRLERLPSRDYLEQDQIRFLTDQESKRLLAWIKENDLWLYPKIVVLLHTGIRFGEMAALRVGDLRLFAASPHLSVSRSRCRHSGEFVLPKGKRARMIPVSDGLKEFLLTLAGDRKSGEPLLWETWEEGRWPSRTYERFQRAIKATNVSRITIHDLRHSFAVRFLERGGHIFDLKEILGHRDIKLTMRYSHFSAAMSERARGVVDFERTAPTLSVVEGGIR